MGKYKFLGGKHKISIFIMLCFMCLLLGGSTEAHAEGETRADLYKNGTYMGDYTTVEAAFAAMTDSSADYVINIEGNHTLSRTSWPAVKSITIDGGTTGLPLLQLPDGDTVLNSNVTLKNYVCLTPVLQDTSSYHCTNVNVQNYTFTVDGEPGIYTAIGYIWGYGEHFGYYIPIFDTWKRIKQSQPYYFQGLRLFFCS